MIRVLIKASSPLVKAGLATLLRSYPQFRLVDDASDEPEPSDGLVADSPPDVVLAETGDGENMNEPLDGSESGVPLILLVQDPAAVPPDAFRHHVRAVLSRSSTASQIAAAIEAVTAGLGVFDPGVLNPFPAFHENHGELPESLTPREIEVLRAMAEGLANKEIAARLGISENTTKFHVAAVMGKLGAGSRTEAVMLGIRHGIVLI
jgi:DNA-binding NarL/FixJ family response regulator